MDATWLINAFPADSWYGNVHRFLNPLNSFSESIVTAGDAEFILRSQLENGDDKAFRKIVEEHSGWMFMLAKRFTNCDADAADCVQESFTIVLKKISDFEGRSSLKTWLHKIVVNQALMKIRKKSNLREQSLDQYLPAYDRNGLHIGPVRISDAPVETLVSQKEIAAKVRLAIAELPDIFRAILILRDLEGYSTIETAQLLHIEEGAVRTRLHRARHALKKVLEPTMGAAYLDDIL